MDKIKKKEFEQSQFELLINGQINNQCGICHDFFDTKTITGLRNNLNQLLETKSLKKAGIGNQSKFQTNSMIRNDEIKWIEHGSMNPFESVFNTKINDFIHYLNQTCYTSLNSFESHYANYDKLSFYKRHLDQFKSNNSRKFSIILYLNEDWKEEDGGMLSIYPKGMQQRNILPTGGSLVFFKSDELEHEVFPSHTRNRMSIAGWLKN